MDKLELKKFKAMETRIKNIEERSDKPIRKGGDPNMEDNEIKKLKKDILDEVFDKVDADKNGVIDKTEWIQYATEINNFSKELITSERRVFREIISKVQKGGLISKAMDIFLFLCSLGSLIGLFLQSLV